MHSPPNSAVVAHETLQRHSMPPSHIPQTDWHVVFTLGLLLTAGLIAGILARMIRIPRVTSYLLIGLALGPKTRELLPTELAEWLPAIPDAHLHHLEVLGKVAMALVLLTIGCHFPLAHFRRILKRVMRLSAGELSVTFLLVAIGMTLVGQTWQVALLYGALALATAPATTILVLKDNESEGPVTEYATALVALNNLAAVIIFEVLFGMFGWEDSGILGGLAHTGELFLSLGKSLILGIVTGLVVSFFCGLLSPRSWLVLLVAATAIVLGACGLWHMPWLLAFLAMGATIANASDKAQQIVGELDRVTGLLCVIFFVIHGAEMDITALFAAGVVGIVYIATRLSGKFLGIWFTADPHVDGPQVKRWLGTTLMAQAGAAIMLASIAAEKRPEIGLEIQNIILGAVVFFELAGPVLIRVSLLRAGEVPLAQAIGHTSTTIADEFRRMINRLRIALGLDPWARRVRSEIKVSEVMRTNMKGLAANADFDDVIAYMHHSHDNVFPVVGDEGELVGLIRYPNVRSVLFDPSLGSLVNAADIAIPVNETFYPDEPITDAWAYFQRQQDDAVPVIAREEPHRLLGIVRRRDLYQLFIQRQGGNDSGH